jgi:hypothetical protein
METLTLYAEDGTQYRAFVHQERIDASSMDGVASIPGMQTIRLRDGTPLNYVDNETFKNAVTGELLTRTPKKKP